MELLMIKRNQYITRKEEEKELQRTIESHKIDKTVKSNLIFQLSNFYKEKAQENNERRLDEIKLFNSHMNHNSVRKD